MLTSNPIQYYAADFSNNLIVVFDINWNVILAKSFQKPEYIIPVGTSLYITSDSIIWRTDRNLNILSQYIASGTAPHYRGVFYNPTNNAIYVVAYFTSTIHTFNLNPTLTSSLVLSSTLNYIWSISVLKNQWYVGTSVGTIWVIFNNQVISKLVACGGNSQIILSILFDGFGNMATSCNNKLVYLYNTNGVYLSKNFLLSDTPYDIGFDSNSRFVVIAKSRIDRYY